MVQKFRQFLTKLLKKGLFSFLNTNRHKKCACFFPFDPVRNAHSCLSGLDHSWVLSCPTSYTNSTFYLIHLRKMPFSLYEWKYDSLIAFTCSIFDVNYIFAPYVIIYANMIIHRLNCTIINL